ncbi:sugar kinase [Prauserella marina]|uniref:ROK family protein (Putative glucokinase) n=1 Tax=Prauserella marina TaxID=530584 RepID=A0A222VT09_9PSEU|nr:ROK family protein [Prauserella marina]ASR37066.1 sugar kinase [Prauserella marina]PWV79950.1 glucokinase-like ROK family protein [Prauserella marina]SDD86376.1 ROK family protein (putative glucokinase) [Prauserella marina]
MVEDDEVQASQTRGPGGLAPDYIDSLAVVLDLVRSGTARTRPELSRRSGLGRTVVTQRVNQLAERGLLEEGALGPSSGGRAPRELRFRAGAGVVLAAELGATSIVVGVTDLSGNVLAEREENTDIALGPEPVLDLVESLFEVLLDEVRATTGAEPSVWGVGIGLPGPVEFAKGRPSAPPIMPGWDGYPVRDRIAAKYSAPVWVDNEVNTMALGELRAGSAKGQRDILYIKMGTGIGAGLISGGHIHRGSQGCAGDIGHAAVADEATVVCRCGNTGCLEAYAGGAALARDGLAAAEEGRSEFLAAVLAENGAVTAADLSRAAQSGDRTSVELLTRAGRLVGNLLATLVSFYNPALVIIGGGVAGAGDLLLAAVRESVYRRSLPLATRELRLTRSTLSDRAGLVGAAFMVIDELFTPERLGYWVDAGSPAGSPDLVEVPLRAPLL